MSEQRFIDFARTLCRKYALEPFEEDLVGMALPAHRLVFKAAHEPDLPLGASKFGGHPDMPSRVDGWPSTHGVPHSFVGQFNLADAYQASQRVGTLWEEMLPTAGVLYVFMEAQLGGGAGRAMVAISKPSDRLERGAAGPEVLAANPRCVLPCFSCEFVPSITFPEPYCICDGLGMNTEQRRRYFELQRGNVAPRHQFMGWPHEVQEGLRESCGRSAALDPRAPKDPSFLDPLRWQLILQLDPERPLPIGSSGSTIYVLNHRRPNGHLSEEAWAVEQVD